MRIVLFSLETGSIVFEYGTYPTYLIIIAMEWYEQMIAGED